MYTAILYVVLLTLVGRLHLSLATGSDDAVAPRTVDSLRRENTTGPLIVRVLVVADARHYIYADYARLALTFLQQRQLLYSADSTAATGGNHTLTGYTALHAGEDPPGRHDRNDEQAFVLETSVVLAPRNDSDATFYRVCRAYRDGFGGSNPADFILDLTVAPLSSAVIKSFAVNQDVPSVSLMCCGPTERIQDVFSSLPARERARHLVLTPPSKVWFRVIRDYVVSENMSTAAVIMDDTFELERAQRMLLSDLGCKHIILRLNFDDELALRNFTTKMIVQGIRNFFIIAKPDNAGKFLEEAYNLDLVDSGRRPHWFVISKEYGHVQCPQCSSGQIVKLKPMIQDGDLRFQFTTFVSDHSDMRDIARYENYNEIDMLYVLDGSRAGLSAYVAAVRSLNNSHDTQPAQAGTVDKQEITVTCDDKPLVGGSPTKVKVNLRQGKPTVDLLGFISGQQLRGVLGQLIPGSKHNTSLIDAKLAVEEQTILYEITNITKQYGTWSHSEGLRDTRGRFPRAITSKRLRVTILVEEPFIFRTLLPDNDTASSNRPVLAALRKPKYNYTGYLIDLIQRISQELKFEYDLYEVPDQQFGAVDENGEWNGLIRELVDKKADIALAPLSVMAERENVVDFTVPYFDLVGISILMKKSGQEQSLFKFVTVLEAPVWGSILGAYLLTSLLMFIFDRYSPYSYRNTLLKTQQQQSEAAGKPAADADKPEGADFNKADLMQAPPAGSLPAERDDIHDEYGTRVFTLKESLWFCMTSLTPQGGGEAPRNLSGRLVAATWWMFGFIIIASYTANLAAFLTVSRLETQIDSLDALARQYGIRYAALENSATETYFKRMWKIEEKFYEIWRDMSLNESMSDKERAELAVWDYPVSDKYTKLWLTMKDFDKPKTYEEGVDWVKATKVLPSGEKDGFALIGDTAILQYKANLDCNLTIVGEEFSRKPYALAVQEGSPLRDQLSGVILKLLNQRELELMKEEWWQTRNQKSCQNNEDENAGISIENIGGVFILVLVGTVLACVMLAFEYYWYKRRAQKQQADISLPGGTAAAQGTAKPANINLQRYNPNLNTNPDLNFHNVFSQANLIPVSNSPELDATPKHLDPQRNAHSHAE
ncbi:ionotropic receptor 25a-like [Paramacrobiotus metropolitanus]|uniref:ionotropic receptor 25a-like n=1 Tax=Paramacrobiotus metropolitanus TaxID=2943436 RepID=UPI002445C5ED|nr:ionotropic receptor 25a-like [Paramacrobiotus metropolitanus]